MKFVYLRQFTFIFFLAKYKFPIYNIDVLFIYFCIAYNNTAMCLQCVLLSGPLFCLFMDVGAKIGRTDTFTGITWESRGSSISCWTVQNRIKLGTVIDRTLFYYHICPFIAVVFDQNNRKKQISNVLIIFDPIAST